VHCEEPAFVQVSAPVQCEIGVQAVHTEGKLELSQ
jgi:hypothetical protein